MWSLLIRYSNRLVCRHVSVGRMGQTPSVVTIVVTFRSGHRAALSHVGKEPCYPQNYPFCDLRCLWDTVGLPIARLGEPSIRPKCEGTLNSHTKVAVGEAANGLLCFEIPISHEHLSK